MNERTEKLITENVQMEVALKIISNYLNAEASDEIKLKLVAKELEEIQEKLGRKFRKFLERA
jgi:hypothetical protein